ncbi:hypothetical protein, partial [Reichenbachiella sp. MALMAid0571]|uniref:hypothetical protein n=1 Tax=Reichenbachiella sp. MALMAid0571 TaxID=3143939 RepID=UPI0032DFA30A
KYPEKVRLNEMRKDFFDFLKLPPSPEGVIKKSPLGDLGVILMNFLRWQNLFSDTNSVNTNKKGCLKRQPFYLICSPDSTIHQLKKQTKKPEKG